MTDGSDRRSGGRGPRKRAIDRMLAVASRNSARPRERANDAPDRQRHRDQGRADPGRGHCRSFHGAEAGALPCARAGRRAAGHDGLERLGARRHRRGRWRRRHLAVARGRYDRSGRGALRSGHRSTGRARSAGAHRRSRRHRRAVRPRRERPHRCRTRSRAFARPHRACLGRSGRRGNHPHPRRARARDALHRSDGRFPRRRTGDGRRPRHRPVRTLRQRRRCETGAVPRAGRDLRHRRPGRALCASPPIRWKRAAKASAWRRAPARSSPIPNSCSSIPRRSPSAAIPRRSPPKRCAAKARS